MRQSRRLGFLLASAGLLYCPHRAFTAHVISTWTGTSGSWSVASNWSSNPVYPNNSGGNTYDAVINSPSANVTLDAAITVDGFTLNNGTLAGTSSLTTGAAVSWGGGTISGSGTLNINGSLQIGSLSHNLSGFRINIGSLATATWSAGNLNDIGSGGGTIANIGNFNDQTDSSWIRGNAQTPVFNNSGTYSKSAGTAQSLKQIQAVFNNSGTVTVQTSDLWLSGGGKDTGTFSVASGARLLFSDYAESFSATGSVTTTFSSTSNINSMGTVVFTHSNGNATTSFGGKYYSAYTTIDTGTLGEVNFAPGAVVGNIFGDLSIVSGTVAFNTGGVTPWFTNGTLTAGGLAGNDNVFFDHLSWTSGTIQGDGASSAVLANLSLNVSGSAKKALVNQVLYNGGASSATISGGEIDLSYSDFVNSSPSTLDIQGDVLFENIGSLGFSSRVFNDGAVTKSMGSGTCNFDNIEFFNDGTLGIQSGAIRLGGGGDHSGTFTISANSTLELSSSPASDMQWHVLEPTSIINGPVGSNLRLVNTSIYASGLVNVGEIDVDGATVNLSSGASASALTTQVKNNGQINYSGGTLSAGNLSLSIGGKVVLSAGKNKTLQTTAINIDASNGSYLDLADNRAIVDYAPTDPSPINKTRQQIQTGYNSGNWTGAGITTSMGDSAHGLGYADNSVLHLASFGGISGVDSSSVLLKYSYFGDANFDGHVDVADLFALAQHWNTSGDVWTSGDFNYDGSVNLADLKMLTANWGAGVGSPFMAPDLAPLLASLNLPNANAPEPAILGLFVAFMSLPHRRRRQ